MPEKETLERARRDKEEGKSPATQAGEFLREEIDHVREGKHGARSVQQAIAIGLSKARRAGLSLPPPKQGETSPGVRKRATGDLRKNRSFRKPPSPRSALSSQAHRSARRRGAAARSNAVRRARHTKGRQGLVPAARRASRTRRSQLRRG